jgi:Na+/phosphate symporter
LIINGLIHEDIQQVREAKEKAIQLYESIKDFKNEIFRNFATLPEEIQDRSFLFVQALDYLSELSNSLHQLVPAICNHVENRHKGLTEIQQQNLLNILDEMTAYFNFQVHLEKDKRFSEITDLKQKQSTLKVMLEEIRIEHIRRIRTGEGKTRINVIYMEILGETYNLVLYAFNLFQALNEFNKQARR